MFTNRQASSSTKHQKKNQREKPGRREINNLLVIHLCSVIGTVKVESMNKFKLLIAGLSLSLIYCNVFASDG